MEATGCATGVAICACSPVRHRRDRPQVLPAYGLQDLRNKSRNLKTKSNANTTCLQNTLGEDHGSGHFYLAENRTFLLCVDIWEISNSGGETSWKKRNVMRIVVGDEAILIESEGEKPRRKYAGGHPAGKAMLKFMTTVIT